MKSAEIRSRFLDFFASRGHEIVPSSPLVPGDDPTLLFTNSGMVQFKDVFLGRERRGYARAVTSQRCVRAGGKHNDLENVGYTARHHTFFEMLGNFSFGDYFKKEAIAYAWEFLTKELGLPPSRLWVTVYKDDDEAAEIWLNDIGVPAERFSRMDEKDNFWAMGDTGPCGPCSEIFYDHGPEVAGGPPGSDDEDGDRYIEIWNLVFMQFERRADGTMEKLPRPSVDTGAGLERLSAVLQEVHSNYEIDLFRDLIADIASLTGSGDLENKSLRVIADHIRSCAFLVVDGVVPANEGRGYVLRRILRRAVRHGHRLGLSELFFYKLVKPLCKVMGDAYPELNKRRKAVEKVLKEEEEQFIRTLENGMVILSEAMAGLVGDAKGKLPPTGSTAGCALVSPTPPQGGSDTLPGDVVFKLYDTYGFPVDLTADVAREHGLQVDLDGFDTLMARQRERARAAGGFAAQDELQLDPSLATAFTGYDSTEGKGRVLALFKVDGAPLEEVGTGEEALVLLDSSPFYGESGGQVGDTGELHNRAMRMQVLDTQKQGEALLHRGRMAEGSLAVGDEVRGQVAAAERLAITLNHSATHLMHAALRNILGEHVTQKGSLVEADRLRFDFSHPASVTPEELAAIEDMVNEQILLNAEVSKEVMPIAAAREKGALALFGEKYGDQVRVVSMGHTGTADYSIEFCGGCHVQRTGDIGLFKITAESGISAGVRRLEAVTGKGALALIGQRQQALDAACAVLKTSPEELPEKLQQLSAANRSLEKQLRQLQARLASGTGQDLAEQAVEVGGARLLTAEVEGYDAKSLRETVDRLKQKLGTCVIVLASSSADDEDDSTRGEDEKARGEDEKARDKGGATKVSLIAGISKDLTAKIKAGDLVNMVAGKLGGKGGGRPDMAMAGATVTDPTALPKALASVQPWVKERIEA